MSSFDEDSPDLQWLASELSAIRRELTPASESRSLYLALDQGGTSSRAVLYDAVGREVALAHVPITTRRQGDRVEHVPDELVQSLLTAACDACESPLVAGRPIVAAGLATQRSTICCWDKRDGAALSPAISWADRRNARWLEQHLSAHADWVRELTGLPLSPHYGASKLRWCLDELPAVRLALRDERLAAGPLASFLLHRLCEQERPLLADPANAARTLLFDPALLDWSNPLLGAFEIPREILPLCVGSVHDFGTLALPGRSRIPIRACTGDQSAALFAFGIPSPGTAYVNVGTGAFVQRPLRDGAASAPRGLLKSVVFAHTDAVRSAIYCHEGTVNGAYAAIEWLRGRVALDVTRALGAIGSTELADSTTLLFMNGVGGLGAPFWSPSFPTEFLRLDGPVVNDRPPGSEMEQLAAVLDSIAFLVAANLQAMQRSSALQRVVITGGLSSCDYLCDVLAEATGLNVERPELQEATARGIAFLAAAQPADWQSVPLDRTFAPRGREAVRQRFGRWREEVEKRVMVRSG
jgi:glycerol kinase